MDNLQNEIATSSATSDAAEQGKSTAAERLAVRLCKNCRQEFQPHTKAPGGGNVRYCADCSSTSAYRKRHAEIQAKSSVKLENLLPLEWTLIDRLPPWMHRASVEYYTSKKLADLWLEAQNYILLLYTAYQYASGETETYLNYAAGQQSDEEFFETLRDLDQFAETWGAWAVENPKKELCPELNCDWDILWKKGKIQRALKICRTFAAKRVGGEDWLEEAA